MDLTESIFSFDFFQTSNPSFKYPNTLSKPTLDNLVIVSTSKSFSQTTNILVLISLITEPTQGAKPPFNPIKIEPGINP